MYERKEKEKENKKKQQNHTGIPMQMKSAFERNTGLSFDDVKVHYHSDRPAKLDALAYTQGNQVYIGPGQEKHLSHELGHVVQQKQGRVRPTTRIGGVGVNDDAGLEREADLGILGQSKEAGGGNDNIIQRKVTVDGTEYNAGNIGELIDRLKGEIESKKIVKQGLVNSLVNNLAAQASSRKNTSYTFEGLVNSIAANKMTIGDGEEIEMGMEDPGFTALLDEAAENLSVDEIFSSIFLQAYTEYLQEDKLTNYGLFQDKDEYRKKLKEKIKKYLSENDGACYLSKDTLFDTIKKALISRKNDVTPDFGNRRRPEKPERLKKSGITHHHMMPIGFMPDHEEWREENLVAGVDGKYRVYDPGDFFDIEALDIKEAGKSKEDASNHFKTNFLQKIYECCVYAEQEGKWRDKTACLTMAKNAKERIEKIETEQKGAIPALNKLIDKINTETDIISLAAQVKKDLVASQTVPSETEHI